MCLGMLLSPLNRARSSPSSAASSTKVLVIRDKHRSYQAIQFKVTPHWQFRLVMIGPCAHIFAWWSTSDTFGRLSFKKKSLKVPSTFVDAFLSPSSSFEREIRRSR